MSALDDLSQALAKLCGDIYSLRMSPRPDDANWRTHMRSLEEALERRKECRASLDDCIKRLEASVAELPPPWLGHEPTSSRYIRLERSLGTLRFWLHEFQKKFRGYKMPMESDSQDQHDGPDDVKDWNDAEAVVWQAADELVDYAALRRAHEARTHASKNQSATSGAAGASGGDTAALAKLLRELADQHRRHAADPNKVRGAHLAGECANGRVFSVVGGRKSPSSLVTFPLCPCS